jgi:tetratricopeptide (TPR) repeat protein
LLIKFKKYPEEDYFVRLAYLYEITGKADLITKTLERGLSVWPQSFKIRYVLCQRQFADGDFGEVLKTLTGYINNDTPFNVQLIYVKALLNNDQANEASVAMEQYFPDDWQDRPQLANLGAQVYQKAGFFTKAEEIYKKLQKNKTLAKDSSWQYLDLLVRSGKQKEALSLINQLDPNDLDNLFQVAQIYANLEDYKHAEGYLNQYLNRQKNINPAVLRAQADIQLSMGAIQKAKDNYRKSLSEIIKQQN